MTVSQLLFNFVITQRRRCISKYWLDLLTLKHPSKSLTRYLHSLIFIQSLTSPSYFIDLQSLPLLLCILFINIHYKADKLILVIQTIT
jgi:hypothetical protein